VLSYQVFTTVQAENDILSIEDYITDELHAPLSAVRILCSIKKKFAMREEM